jgi:hypothetical protein
MVTGSGIGGLLDELDRVPLADGSATDYAGVEPGVLDVHLRRHPAEHAVPEIARDGFAGAGIGRDFDLNEAYAKLVAGAQV